MNEKPITGRTNGTNASTKRVGSIEGMARTDGADFGRFRAIEATQFSGGRVTAGK
jgi:hypothetical protein